MVSNPLKKNDRDILHGGPLARQDLFSNPEEREPNPLAFSGEDENSPEKAPKKIPDITPQVLRLLGPFGYTVNILDEIGLLIFVKKAGVLDQFF